MLDRINPNKSISNNDDLSKQSDQNILSYDKTLFESDESSLFYFKFIFLNLFEL